MGFALAGAISLCAAAQQPTFRGGTRLVSVYATVTDAERRLVPSLTEQDFEILDNDKPQPLAFFRNETEPITVVVMLDTSYSMTRSIPLLRSAAEQFLLRLLPADKARVGAFNDKIEISSHFSSNRDALIGELKDLDYGNGTRLWDAVSASLDALQGIEGRRVVLVLTDGDDTQSKARLGGVTDAARADDVMVYAIGLESDYFDIGANRNVRSKPDGGLKKIAEETGGGYFELKKTADLSPTFTRVAQELHSQYALGFSPKELDGRVHKLTVRAKQAGMTVRARKSYLASAEKAP